MKFNCLTIAICVPIHSETIYADDFERLLSLSLKELTPLNVNPPAVITSLPTEESPAKITVISASDIRLSPARNTYDLLRYPSSLHKIKGCHLLYIPALKSHQVADIIEQYKNMPLLTISNEPQL